MKHPGRWWWLVLLVPIIFGLARLHFDVEVFDLLPSDLPVVKGLKLYQQYFANARELIITLRAPDATQAETAARTLAAALREQTNLVASVTWQPPWLEHPADTGELLAYLWFNQPPQLFQELTNRLAPEKLPALLAETRERLATTLSPDEIARSGYDPFGLTRLPEDSMSSAPDMSQGQQAFRSAAGDFRVLYVKAATDLPTYRECDQWLRAIRAIPVPTGVQVAYTGRPAFVAEVAGGMQHDVKLSVGGTALIIAVLFWLAHRRLKPMFWLLILLALILGSTLALGGLIFGSINVVSMGFAAILLGLAVDYAVVHYQEALAHPTYTIPEIRSAIAPSIFWAAVTTISAFLVLNFGGLPGLGQLGTLVALGVALSACIMIFEFLPPLFPERNKPRDAAPTDPTPEKQMAEGTDAAMVHSPLPFRRGEGQGEGYSIRTSRLVFALSALLLVFDLALLIRGLPAVDPTADSLRPRHSPAYAALDEIKRELNQNREPLWLIIGGQNETEVARRLDQVQAALQAGESNRFLASFTLPSALWPHPQFQAANRAAALHLASEKVALTQAALTNGFTENAVGLTGQMLDTWLKAGQSNGVFWPSNELCQWIFEKATARSGTNQFALGLINSDANSAGRLASDLARLQTSLPPHGVWLSGWELLGHAIFSRVKANMWFVLAPMVGLVLLSLWLAFRRPTEILLSLAVLVLSAFSLLAVMRLVGWSWNLLNLMALPLILGTGVDYSIFMQLALRRHHGDLRMAYFSVGRALLLCGGTACAGFGSLAFSTNAGMGSLGQVCAVGIGFNMIISIFLLPIWWRKLVGSDLPPAPSGATAQKQAGAPDKPSSFYRAEIWRLGLWLARALSRRQCAWLCRALAALYWLLAARRREVVIRNLMPAVGNDRQTARQRARRLFDQFALKLVDLWRYEAGLPIETLFGKYTGWEHFLAAQNQKRGVLLLTPHLGNWEFGAPWLARRGVTLQVITMAEPSAEFTRLRLESRKRWNIETLVIGEDPFAFLEVIRRLEAGASVALLVDRPPAASAVTVELFGQPFAASVAAAELARASGCILLPVYLPASGAVYDAHILAPVPYERAALRDRAARQQLTQEIIRQFEPIIRQYLEQWYHFVPVWPDRGSPDPQQRGKPSGFQNSRSR